jgi:hypothetical protein
MRLAYCVNKPTNIHSECVILSGFLWQKWLQECASTLRYTYIACIVTTCSYMPILIQTNKQTSKQTNKQTNKHSAGSREQGASNSTSWTHKLILSTHLHLRLWRGVFLQIYGSKLRTMVSAKQGTDSKLKQKLFYNFSTPLFFLIFPCFRTSVYLFFIFRPSSPYCFLYFLLFSFYFSRLSLHPFFTFRLNFFLSLYSYLSITRYVVTRINNREQEYLLTDSTLTPHYKYQQVSLI